jgi:hypothetical protein
MFLAEIIPEGEHHLKRIQRTITSAELLTLQITAITLLPAPGPGKRYAVFAVFTYYQFSTTPFTLNATTALLLVNGSNILAFISTIGLLDQSNDIVLTPALSGAPSSGTTAFNQPLVLGNGGTANLTLGDGTLLLVVYYAIEGDH